MLYVIICDGSFDGICEGERERDKEVRDLRKMGFVVKVKSAHSWDEAYKIQARLERR